MQVRWGSRNTASPSNLHLPMSVPYCPLLCHLHQLNTSCFVLFPLPDQKMITAESGQNVTLTCRAPNNNILVVKWSRADLKEEYVLLYRDEQFVPGDQHPSFKNRVDLQDRQMKDGDVSLILKNVTIADNGTYECSVFMSSPNNEHICNISLSVVVPPGQTGGDTEDGGKEDGVNRRFGLVASGLLLFLGLILVVGIIFLVVVILSKLSNRNLSSHLPSESAASFSETIVSLR
ncbi:unnamed protein product [Oreochromis niloticus]|nr:unnamed protein product [Mustela putorius furo]